MLGNLILESERKGKGGILPLAVLGLACIIGGIAIVAFSGGLDGEFGRTGIPMNVVGITFGIFLILGGAGYLFAIKSGISASKSFINVYSEGVKGQTVDEKAFELSFEQIQNVETLGSVVSIHANYTVYKCAAGNAEDIGKTIFKLKNQ